MFQTVDVRLYSKTGWLDNCSTYIVKVSYLYKNIGALSIFVFVQNAFIFAVEVCVKKHLYAVHIMAIMIFLVNTGYHIMFIKLQRQNSQLLPQVYFNLSVSYSNKVINYKWIHTFTGVRWLLHILHAKGGMGSCQSRSNSSHAVPPSCRLHDYISYTGFLGDCKTPDECCEQIKLAQTKNMDPDQDGMYILETYCPP